MGLVLGAPEGDIVLGATSPNTMCEKLLSGFLKGARKYREGSIV